MTTSPVLDSLSHCTLFLWTGMVETISDQLYCSSMGICVWIQLVQCLEIHFRADS
ncbi:uncharacterized protein BDW47DRAFT_104581 [Aspergillus candidus]|uniref:Uncharacterized protein n=1 Tax=Aspergillus candidus TaxID=41067 RepID=A0A2I2FDA5_ASPCN|nr:hypothetical protein BDW47DRAFT_104581 [Aspergillus candidus]PLB38623.1 hypothetical protein BDW47DRAFT_104581 [Aspergillus candidus]